MKVYITGINGLLGKALEIAFKDATHGVWGCDINPTSYSQIDIRDRAKLIDDIERFDPQIVIHTAAMINVEECQKDFHRAFMLNVEGTRNVLMASKGRKFIYISTHAVYSGFKGKSLESEQPLPINNYALTKYMGEKEVIEMSGDHLILRVNFVGFNGRDKRNFMEWVYDHVKSGKKVKVFSDYVFQPLTVRQLSNVILEILHEKGVYNIGCSIPVYKAGFAAYFVGLVGLDADLVDYVHEHFEIPRPFHCTVNVDKISKLVKLPSWQEVAKDLVKDVECT